MAEVCGRLNAAHGRLVGLVSEVLESGCWQGAGILTCEQWVAWKTGLSPGRAHDVVLLARRSRELPTMTAALAEGVVSVDQATVVARHTPVAFEADVVALAQVATVSQLRRSLRSYCFDPHDATAGRLDPSERTGVGGWFDDRGRYRLRAVLEADDGAVVDAALREARDHLFRVGDAQVSWVEALVEVASRSLGGAVPAARQDLFAAGVHVPLDRPGGAYWHGGPALPEGLRRQLLCDATGDVVGVRAGRPVDVGRRRRIVPAHTRRVVEDRDGGCRVPGCTNTRVQIHHLVHWEDGGPTDVGNLVALCHRHHRLHHRHQLGITGDPDRPDGLIFTDHTGRPLATRPPPTPPTDDPDPVVVTGRWRHPTGERLHTRWIHFNPQPRPG